VRLPRIRLTAPQAPVLLTGLVWLVAIALSAWILAGWYWRLKAPSAIAAAPPEVTDPIAAAKLVSARHLFGEVQQAAAAPVVMSRYTLLGVAADTAAKRGFAVIAEEGKPAEGYIQGEELAPGVRLSAIRADSVEIERNGQKEVVRLSEKAGAATGTTPAPANPGLTTSQGFMNSQSRFAQRNIGTPPVQPQVQQQPQPQVQSQPQPQSESQENNQLAQ